MNEVKRCEKCGAILYWYELNAARKTCWGECRRKKVKK